MADHTPSPPQDTFSTIAEGYGGAQQTLARLGFLPGAMPGSFSPSDRNGTAVQFPTPAPPRFPTVVSTTLPFPSAVPQFAGAVSPQPPSVLPPMFSTPQPTFTQGMPSANYAPQAPSYAPAMAPQAAPYPFGVPTAAPNWTRAFTQPMQGFGHPGAAFGGGSLFSDAVQAGYVPRPMFMEGPGIGVNTMQQRAGAGLRMNQRFEDWGASAISGASVGIGALGGAAALGIGGATLGGIASAAGLIAAPMMAASAWTGAYQDERAGTRAVQNVFSGMSMGPMMSPLGQGINPIAARQIQNKFKESTHGGDFTTGDMFSTMSMAQESGLMRGHTNSVDQVVTRVKELAKVTKSIMDLGQGITQQDAIELQAIASNMGIGTSQFAGQGLGKKLVTAARATGQTVQDVMSGVGAQGASLFAQAGMNAGSGMMVGIHTAGVSAGMVNSGMFSQRELSALGGESGIQNTMAQGIARFQAQNAGNMMRGMLTGPDALHAMQTGTLSMADASKQGGAIFKDQNLTSKQRKLAAQFFDEAAPDMLSDMQSKMTPERMQAMQIAQAASLMRDSKGTMTANTAFTKVTGSEEGAKVLMKLMEHPEILRAQSAQASLLGMEEVNRSASSYDSSQGGLTKVGDWLRGGIESIKKGVGVSDAGDWAARRDYMQEANAVGVDPSGYQHRYKNLVSGKKLLEDFSSGAGTLRALLRTQEGRAVDRRSSKFVDGDTDFAVNALTDMGIDVGDTGTWDFLAGDSTKKTLQEQRRSRISSLLDEQKSTVFTMDEYSKFSNDPSAAGKFLENLNKRGGTPGDVGRVMTKVASDVSALILESPDLSGRILSDSNLTTRIDTALRNSGIQLTATQRASVMAETKQAIGANMAVSTSDDSSKKDAAAKAVKLAMAVKNSSKGEYNADMAAEDFAKGATTEDAEYYLKQYTKGKGSWFTNWDDRAKEAQKSITEFSDAAAGAGLSSEEDIQLLITSGGTRDGLQRVASSGTETQRATATRLLNMDPKKAEKLFAQAKSMRAELVAASEDGVDSEAFKSMAKFTSGHIGAVKDGAAAAASRELMQAAGLMVPGATKGSQAMELIQNTVASSTATSGRQLAIEALGEENALKGASWDATEKDWNALAVKKNYGGTADEIKALVEKIAAKRLTIAQRERDEKGEGAILKGPAGSDSSAGVDVATQNLQEMREYNKQAFEALKTLTSTSQKTVDSMTNFISEVSSKLAALESR